MSERFASSYILRGAAISMGRFAKGLLSAAVTDFAIDVADGKSCAGYRKNRLSAGTRWRLGEIGKTE